MRECKQCLQLKELTDYYKDAVGPDGYKVTCKACICKNARDKRSKHPIGQKPHSIEDQRFMAHIYKRYKQFDGTREIEIPVRALNHPHPAKRACVIRRVDVKNFILISSLKGLREYEFELVSPQSLLEILKELQLQVYIHE